MVMPPFGKASAKVVLSLSRDVLFIFGTSFKRENKFQYYVGKNGCKDNN